MLKMQSFRFEELAWTVRVDAKASTLGVQLRNGTQKWAGYCMIDLATGQPGPIISLENAWWTELLGVSGNLLHIGRYGDGALPVISETFAIDGTQALVITDFEWNPEAQEEELKVPANLANPSIDLSPTPLPGSWIAELQHESMHLRAWHHTDVAGAALRLGIWSDVTLQFQITLEENMDKLNPSPFFVAGNWLIFIRNRMELCWIDLAES
jgi:hypothetical protein